ncbi:MAG: molybdopterin-dependent oxidoreductase, partial [Chloroflexi bacterium]|nr:molybdopterin-dependent oxidoreductase [Chloroflexota bacterium]
VDEGYLPALIDLALLKGLGPQGASLYPIRRGGNAQGALDMGVHPRLLPGHQSIEDPTVRERMEKLWGAKLPSEPGRDTRQILSGAAAGEIVGLYILGADPLAHYPDRGLVEEALSKVELLIVQELFLTETATRAQVVLPAAAFAEKGGTFTNLERRVQRIWPATPPRGQAKTDAEILSALAVAMGHRFEHPTAEAIWEELRRVAPVYAGMTYARLGEVGLQWPCPAPDHPGSEHLPADWLPDEWVPLPEPELTALREGEFHLVVGPWLFDGGNMVSRTQLLRYLVPEPRLHLHPQDAQRLGIREGQLVRIWADGRALELPAHIAHTIQPGAVFAYGNLPGAALNQLGTRRVYIEVGAG